MALCKSEKEYLREVKRLKVKNPPPFLSEHAAATVIPLRSRSGELLCIVTIRDSFKGYSKPEINGILCHEATHVWQFHEKAMGEEHTSQEFEAYCIQAISQKLMEAYWNVKTYPIRTKPL